MKFKDIYEKHKKVLEKENPSLEELREIFSEIKNVNLNDLTKEDKIFIDNLMNLAKDLRQKLLYQIQQHIQKRKAIKEYLDGGIYTSSYRNKV